MQRRIDEGAASRGGSPSGRDPPVYNLPDEITEAPAAELLHGPVEDWVETLTTFAIVLGFDTFIFWPGGDARRQAERFAEEVVPGVRDSVTRARHRSAA
jgi:hypothetical protein